MSKQQPLAENHMPTGGEHARARLLAGAPLTERRLQLAGVSTAVLEGGDGPPVVVLHGQGGFAAQCMPLIAGLVATNHVIAPDLPGLGASQMHGAVPDTEMVMAWLADLIDATCDDRPALVGMSLGGAIAARFRDRPRRSHHPDRAHQLRRTRWTARPAGSARPHPLQRPPDRAQPRQAPRPRHAEPRTGPTQQRRTLGTAPHLHARTRPHPRRAHRQQATAARAWHPTHSTRRPGPHRRPHHAHLGSTGPRHAAAPRTASGHPPPLAAPHHRRRRTCRVRRTARSHAAGGTSPRSAPADTPTKLPRSSVGNSSIPFRRPGRSCQSRAKQIAASQRRCCAANTLAAWPSFRWVRCSEIDAVTDRRPSGEATTNWV